MVYPVLLALGNELRYLNVPFSLSFIEELVLSSTYDLSKNTNLFILSYGLDNNHIGRYVILRQGALIEEECNEIESWTSIIVINKNQRYRKFQISFVPI